MGCIKPMHLWDTSPSPIIPMIQNVIGLISGSKRPIATIGYKPGSFVLGGGGDRGIY